MMTSRGEGWAGGDNADSGGDASDTEPAGERNFFVEKDARNEGDENVSERCGGQNISEIGPRERRHIGRKKGQQEQDSDCDPRIEDGEEQAGEVVQ